MVDHNNPQSRNEEILIATIDGKEYNKPPQSRIEELLLELKEVIEAGSGGGGGINPIGVTTTPLYDGATTNPIQINGESYTAETGDMVTYQSTEFLFNVNEVWQELGDVSVVLAIIDDIFADIAPAFSATSTYAVGDYVIYDDQLYKCTTAHTGAWAAADFTATSLSDEIKNKQNTLTAGKYINIDENNEIKVNPVVPNEAFTYRIYGNNGHHTVEKIVDGVVVHRENHESGEFNPPIIYDDAIKITYYNAGSMKYELLIPSDTHEVGYVQTWAWWNNIDFTETFSTVDHSGEKLITKSDMDTALADKQDALTAGRYINIDANNEIKVNPVVPNETFKYVLQQIENYTIKVTKSVNNVVMSEETYGPPTGWDAPVEATLDEAIHIYIHMTGTMFYDLLIASDTHEAGFKQTMTWYGRDTFTENFSTVDHSGEKLITKSDMDTALASKQGVLTAGDHISIDAQNNISVNRDLVPHQTSYRIKGTGRDTMNITKYIDGVQESSTDYTYSQGTTRTIDDAFTINDAYSSDGYIWQFVWLKDSTTHNKDYIVEYRSYEGAFDFTEVFNDEDLSGYKLVIKSELDAVSEKLPAVPSTDGTYVLTATVTKGETVYSWESNNGLTQEQINALIALLD